MSKYLLTISEHGNEVLTYSDSDKKVFLERSQELIADHLERRSSHPSSSNSTQMKNIQIHIYQVE